MSERAQWERLHDDYTALARRYFVLVERLDGALAQEELREAGAEQSEAGKADLRALLVESRRVPGERKTA